MVNPSIAVVGAGAVGSAVVYSLAQAGFAPKLVARGAGLEAIRRDGLFVDKWTGGGSVHIEASGDAADFGPQDLVIGTMKAQDWPPALPALLPLLGQESVLLPVINGVPWWYFDNPRSAFAGERVAAVDPQGALLAALPAERVVGSVVYLGANRTAPGKVRWTSGNKFVIGEAAGPVRERTQTVAAVLRQAGFDATVTDDIRGEVWAKLLGNAAINPLSVVARARIDEIMADAGLGQIALAAMHEVAAVAAAVGAPSKMECPKALRDQCRARRLSHLDAAGLRGWPAARIGRPGRCRGRDRRAARCRDPDDGGARRPRLPCRRNPRCPRSIDARDQ